MAASVNPSDKDLAIRERILSAFAQQAGFAGPKMVTMTELAKSLAMSTKTLYRHFPNKAALVTALIAQWQESFLAKRKQRIEAGTDAHKRIQLGALECLALNNQFSEAFWLQIERDYSESFSLIAEQQQMFLQIAQGALLPEIRSDLNTELALINLWQIINNMPGVQQCEALNITRQDALLELIDVWARGALRQYQT